MSHKNKNTDWSKTQKKIDKAKSKLLTKAGSSLEEHARILRERAKDFAVSDNKLQEVIETLSILVFTLGKEQYAIKTENLQEITVPSSITEMPCTPPFIYGIINLRGKMVTVIDLKKYLNLDYVGFNDHTSIVVVVHKNELVGIVADQIIGIRSIDKKSIQKTKYKPKTFKDSYISGITDETIIILNIDTVLSDNAIHIKDTIV